MNENTTKRVKIGDIKPNPSNPRLIKDDKFNKLVKSVQDFPEMLELRPIVVNADMVILGGNMRWKACKEAGLKEVPVLIATGLTSEQEREFVIKDNVTGGEWDWEMLAHDWEADELEEWGLDLPKFVESDVDLDAFFEEDNSIKDNKFKIILEYSEEDFNKIQNELKKHSGSKEQIFYKLLGL